MASQRFRRNQRLAWVRIAYRIGILRQHFPHPKREADEEQSGKGTFSSLSVPQRVTTWTFGE